MGTMRPLASGVIRLLIVDDHPVVRAGLTSMLGTQADMTVVGSAASGDEALLLASRLNPDVVLIDLRMPGLSGIETMRALKAQRSSVKPIVLTSFETNEDIYRAVEAGAQGYLMKNAPQNEMLEAIRAVHLNGRYFPPSIAARLADRIARSSLTSREYQALELLTKGLTNRQIGQALQISEHTARNHVNSILEKLGVSDRTEAVITALEQGLVTLLH